MKKIIALIIAMAMVLGMSMSVFAGTIIVESGTTTDGNPSTDVANGETYNAYKILNYTSSDTNDDGTPDAYSYFLTAEEYDDGNDDGLGALLESVGFKFTESADKTQWVLNNAEEIQASVAADLYLIKDDIAAVAIASATETATTNKDTDGKVTAKFENLDTGYWFVTSSLGAVASLQSYDDEALIVEKNSKTVPDKQQGTEAGTYADDQLDVNVGDPVYYSAQIIIGKGANYEITSKDTLSTGLTLDENSITVKVGSADVDSAKYNLTTSASGFEIVFAADYISTLVEGDVINIEYSAVVNEEAVVSTAIPNTFEIDYSKQHFDDHTDVKTYDVQVKKIDATSKEFLAGAGFKLYDSEKDGNLITVKKEDTGKYYKSADADDEIMIETAEGSNIRGLAPGTYWLEETTVPNGYNKLAARVSFTITKNQAPASAGEGGDTYTAVSAYIEGTTTYYRLVDGEYEEITGITAGDFEGITSDGVTLYTKITGEGGVVITVENQSGSVLPSTGSIGTTIFYVAGAILVLGAAVLLVSRRKAA